MAIDRRRLLAVTFAAALALTGAACSDDDGGSADGNGNGNDATGSTEADGALDTTTTLDPLDPDAVIGDTTSTTIDPALTTTTVALGPSDLPEDPCALVPPATVVGGTEFVLPAGVPGGDENRRVCAYTAGAAGGVGVTVGIEAGARFDEKAEASRSALGDEGEPVEGIGDQALFFFSDVDIPEGVGGVLVGIGDRTIDVTVQGLPEGELRAVAEGIAQAYLTGLTGG